MSGKLAMRVLESDLNARLKPVAVALALFGTDAGDSIFPSVARLAWLLGLSHREVQRKLSRLRQLGVLIPQTPLTGGAGRTVHYKLDLAPRAAWEPRHARRSSQDENYDTRVTVSDSERVTAQTQTTTPVTERVTPPSQNPDARVTRSVSDLPEEDKQIKKKNTGAQRRDFVEENGGRRRELQEFRKSSSPEQFAQLRAEAEAELKGFHFSAAEYDCFLEKQMLLILERAGSRPVGFSTIADSNERRRVTLVNVMT